MPIVGIAAAVSQIRSFNRFYTNLIGVLDRHILRSPYSLTEVRLMDEIANEDGGRARELKEILSVDEGYLSRTIERLVKLGLLTKKRSSTDGRVFHLSLSPKGRQEIQRLQEAAGVEVKGIIGHLSKDEAAEVVSCMRRIQVLLGREGGGA